MLPFSDRGFVVPRGCNSCRASKVRCQGQRPFCARCVRLGRECSWPPPRPRLFLRRRGHGSFRSRMGTQPLATLRPNYSYDMSTMPDTQDVGAEVNMSAFFQPDPASVMNAFLGYDEIWEDPSIDIEGITDIEFSAALEGTELPAFTAAESFSAPVAPTMNENVYLDFESFIYGSLLTEHIPLPNSLVLGSEEHSALGHYQSTFSIYRTTKKPKWSTHTLLLDLGNENPMIMHLILAVSINDISLRRENEPPQEAKTHFEVGAREFITTYEKDSATDHISLMVAFLLLYLYIPKRKSVPRERIQQLSKTVLEYVKKHMLDSRCLERTTDTVFVGDAFTEAERKLLARLIIWIYDEDVKCSFQGFGGYLAEHLTAHRERTMAVYEVSRTALEAHWGSKYPEEESADDDENAVELEFLWALTSLWQDINQLPPRPEPGSSLVLQVEQRFKLLAKKYSGVFLCSSQPTMPRTRTLVNADYDVVLFYALHIYLFRSTILDLEMETPSDVGASLQALLNIIRRTFDSNRNELHDRLQWPLFLAGIEVEDGFARDWIRDRLSQRPRVALLKIIKTQEQSGKTVRMEMEAVRSILYEEEGYENAGILTEHGSLMDNLVDS